MQAVDSKVLWTMTVFKLLYFLPFLTLFGDSYKLVYCQQKDTIGYDSAFKFNATYLPWTYFYQRGLWKHSRVTNARYKNLNVLKMTQSINYTKTVLAVILADKIQNYVNITNATRGHIILKRQLNINRETKQTK